MPMIRNRLSLIAALFAATLAVSTGAHAQEVATTPSLPSVTVAEVVETQMVERVPLSGSLVPRDEVLVYPQVTGSTIDTLMVDVGDTVSIGDTLAQLNDRTLAAQLAQAAAEYARSEASVSQAESQITSAIATATRTTAALDRAQRLLTAGTTTQASLDQVLADSQMANAAVASARDGLAVAQAQLQQAQAQLDIAQLNLDRTKLLAPVSGLISARNGQIGAIAASGGEPIFRIITDGVIEAEAEVIETALGQIAVGNAVELTIAGEGGVTGKVRRLTPTVDPVTRLGKIRISVDTDQTLRSGVFVSGWITVLERVSPAVPTAAVLIDAGGTFVLIVKDGVLEKRQVTAGLIWNGQREILEGAEVGESVIAKAGSFFGDGDKINPIMAEAAQ